MGHRVGVVLAIVFEGEGVWGMGFTFKGYEGWHISQRVWWRLVSTILCFDS